MGESQELSHLDIGGGVRGGVLSFLPSRQTRIFLKMEVARELKYNPSQTCMSKWMLSLKYSFTMLKSVISS